MKTWTPPPGEPELFSWWRPLLAFARRARAEQVPWPVYLDEFVIERRVDRPGRPSIWIYRHEEGRGLVMVDDTGTPYRFIVYRRGTSPGRYKEIEPRTAIWHAGLPYAVEPVWYDEPPTRMRRGDEYEPDDPSGGDGDDVWSADDWGTFTGGVERPSPRPASTRPGRRSRRRRSSHLRLVDPAADGDAS
ncbi:MAG: hypothetical protein ACRD29_20185 [Acidimicrobiales bacterium]